MMQTQYRHQNAVAERFYNPTQDLYHKCNTHLVMDYTYIWEGVVIALSDNTIQNHTLCAHSSRFRDQPRKKGSEPMRHPSECLLSDDFCSLQPNGGTSVHHAL